MQSRPVRVAASEVINQFTTMTARNVVQRFRLVADTANALNQHPLVKGNVGIRLQIKFDGTGVPGA